MTDTTGRYEQVDGQPVVRFERTFPHPVGAVWEAVTDSAQLVQWFPTTVEFSELGRARRSSSGSPRTAIRR